MRACRVNVWVSDRCRSSVWLNRNKDRVAHPQAQLTINIVWPASNNMFRWKTLIKSIYLCPSYREKQYKSKAKRSLKKKERIRQILAFG